MYTTTLRRLFCAAVLLAPAAAAAQQQPTAPATPPPAAAPLATPVSPRPATIVRVDALPLLIAAVSFGPSKWLTLRAGAERQLTARTSGAVEALSMSYHRTQVYGVLLQGRYYAVQPKSKQALGGLYLAPHVSMLHFSKSSYYNQRGGTQSQVGIGGRVGVQLPVSPRLRFDTSAGLTGYTAVSNSTGSEAFDGGLAALPMPDLQASFGYVF